MGSFKAAFTTDVIYNDPDYMTIDLIVESEADVSSDERSGSQEDIDYVKSFASPVIMEQFSALSQQKCSYKDLMSKNDLFAGAVAAVFEGRGIVVDSFTIKSVAPTERSQTSITNMDKIKAMGKMSPEELAKAAEEAQKAAERYINSLTPEQRRQAEENAKRMLEEETRKHEEMMAEIAKIRGASATATAATAAAASAAPEFCTNCGAPSKGGKFCCNCGSLL